MNLASGSLLLQCDSNRSRRAYTFCVTVCSCCVWEMAGMYRGTIAIALSKVPLSIVNNGEQRPCFSRTKVSKRGWFSPGGAISVAFVTASHGERCGLSTLDASRGAGAQVSWTAIPSRSADARPIVLSQFIRFSVAPRDGEKERKRESICASSLLWHRFL